MKNQDKVCKGFQISVNDEKPVRAGFNTKLYSITCIISSTERIFKPKSIIDLYVSGSNKENNQYVNWVKRDLAVGDKITIDVINEGFDPPARIERQDTDELLLKSKLKAFHMLKEELKDHIKE